MGIGQETGLALDWAKDWILRSRDPTRPLMRSKTWTGEAQLA